MFGCVVRPDSKLLRVLSVSNRSSFYVLNAKLRTSKRKKDSLQKRVICWKDWEGKAQVSRHRLGYQGREEEVDNRNRNRKLGVSFDQKTAEPNVLYEKGTLGLVNCMSGKVWKNIFHGFYSQKVFTSACWHGFHFRSNTVLSSKMATCIITREYSIIIDFMQMNFNMNVWGIFG